MIPKGSRQDIVNATINSSLPWNSCKLLALTKNMRLRVEVDDDSNNNLRLLAEWILAIGDGLCNGTRLVVTKLENHIIEARSLTENDTDKSQGQSLSNVRLVLKKPVFTHGQLYVAVSRVTHRRRLKVLICHDDHQKKKTDNMVYKEVFQNVD
ncbi:uncharacterized protein LOC107606770 [Arachis ipaensis]|uniref:uncharacterized protein LOC107606770 n=1 Tax=Arachis ipaensis TaxID=130454 RepID=UPI0007AF23DA|nr:uncharacterized protein LOC107606770 [Arachis ipaensis]